MGSIDDRGLVRFVLSLLLPLAVPDFFLPYSKSGETANPVGTDEPQAPQEPGFTGLILDSANLHKPWGKALGDIDGDGRPDVAQNGYWLKQPEKPREDGWGRHEVVPWDRTSAVTIKDMNEDGDLDVVFAEQDQAVGFRFGFPCQFSLDEGVAGPACVVDGATKTG